MNVIKPETSTDVRHFLSVFETSKKKKTEAASIANTTYKKSECNVISCCDWNNRQEFK